MRDIACNLCGTQNGRWVCNLNGFRMVKCSSCGLYYINPQPDDGELRRHYSHYYKPEEFEGRSSYREGSDGLFADILARCKEYKPQGRVLDVGCGYGFFLKLMRDHGYVVQGVELSPSACDYANNRLGLNVFQGFLEEAGFPAAYCDIVVMNNVLEHLADPLSTLLAVNRLLSAGGLLIVAVPNLEFGLPFLYLQRLMGRREIETDGQRGERFRLGGASQLALFDAPNHLYFFSSATLKRTLEQAGFRLLAVSPAAPIENPRNRLRSWSKHLVYEVATALCALSGGSISIGHSLMAYALK
jgi:SAM-dependent methyltransferase